MIWHRGCFSSTDFIAVLHNKPHHVIKYCRYFLTCTSWFYTPSTKGSIVHNTTLAAGVCCTSHSDKPPDILSTYQVSRYNTCIQLLGCHLIGILQGPALVLTRDKIYPVKQPNGINRWYTSFHGWCLHSTNVCAVLNLA